MLLRREGSIGRLGLSDQGAFHSTYLMVGRMRDLVATPSLEKLIEGEL